MERRKLIREPATTILIADDEPVNRSLIQRRLERAGYRVVSVQNGREAVDRARDELPDVVLLDVIMPIMDGLEACLLIKEDKATRDIPIIFLSARDETDVKVNSLSLGASDYISKPFKAEELLARVDVAVRMKRERDNLRSSAEEARADAELAKSIAGIERERAMTDPLTGLLNRYGLDHTLAQQSAIAHETHSPLCCLLIDIDNFKTINDILGHPEGDAAIKKVADILIRNIHPSHFAFRYGGEEFLILIPSCNEKRGGS